jgi:hypothetical protein
VRKREKTLLLRACDTLDGTGREEKERRAVNEVRKTTSRGKSRRAKVRLRYAWALERHVYKISYSVGLEYHEKLVC